MSRAVRKSTSPLGRFLALLLCAVFALGVGVMPARAGAADANRAIGVAKALAASAPANSVPASYGFTASSLNKFHAAIAAVRAGTRTTPVRVLVVGDSTSLGEGSTGVQAQLRTKAWPDLFAGYIETRYDLPGVADCYAGSGNLSISGYNTYNPKTVIPSDWSLLVANSSLGGAMWKAPSTVTSAIAFTPAKAFNRIETGYFQGTGLGTFTVDTGGAALSTVNAAGSNALLVNTASTGGSAATGTINTKRTTGGDIYVIWQLAYNTANPGIAVCNAGRSIWRTTDWAVTTNTWSPANAIAAFAADLTIIDLGINDWRLGVTASDTYANMLVVIDKALLSGDVVVIDPIPSAASQGAFDVQAAISAAVRAAAAARGVPIISVRDRWVDYVTANGLGYMVDTVHPNYTGYLDKAEQIYSRIFP